MSLMGLDVGTTGCKIAVYSEEGKLLSSSYEEYHIQRPNEGWAELDAQVVWQVIQDCIRKCTREVKNDPVTVLAVSSLGEATVAVTKDRSILSPSMLNMDMRGEEFLPPLNKRIKNDRLYEINGNTLGNHYSLTKFLWLQHHQPDIFQKTAKFLHWSGFVSFMLGADAAVDYSLANRTLLFDLDKKTWSTELINTMGVDETKLPDVFPSGTIIGQVSPGTAEDLGFQPGTKILTGAHDQCANAVGCGVIDEGQAMVGMGTFFCVAPVFKQRRQTANMIKLGLNTEHAAPPDSYVSFIYNQGGSLLKWYRDTFAVTDKALAKKENRDIYDELLSEIPKKPARVIVLPHFSPTGPPDFINNSAGVITGLHLDTNRGEILKGILESVVFYLNECLISLSDVNINLSSLRAVGGGSKSDDWIQISADITGLPLERPVNTEAGALGAAIIAGVGSGIYASYEEGCANVVKIDKTFLPNQQQHDLYLDRFAKYKQLYPILRDYLTEI